MMNLGGAGGAEQDRASSLRQFVPQAAELARQRQLSQRGPRHDISTLRTALRLGRQVCTAFQRCVYLKDLQLRVFHWVCEHGSSRLEGQAVVNA